MKTRYLFSHKLLLGMVIFSFLGVHLRAADASPSTTAKFQTVKRQELLFSANQAISDGDRLAESGQYDEAAKRYQFVLDNLIDGGEEAPVFERAESGLAAAKLSQAELLGKDGKFDLAITRIREAITLEPNDPTYQKALLDMQNAQSAYVQQGESPESTVNNPAVTPEFKEKVAAVQKLLFQGQRYFETEQYDMAKATYSKILLLDPTSKIARQKMTYIEGFLSRANNQRREEYRQEKMEDVAHHWSEEISPDVVVTNSNDYKSTEVSNRAVISRKLQTIMLDHVNFQKLDITQVVKFLIERSKELDPDKQGINFVLRLTTNTPPPAPAATPGAPAAPAAKPAPAAAIHREVSITLDNIPLSEVLEYIQSQTGLQFTVDDYAVYLRPSVDEGEFLTVRTFLAPPNLFTGAALTTGGGGAAATVATSTLNVQKELQNKGIVFPDGASATFLPGSSKLVVRDTPEQLDLIASLIDSQSKDVPQVSIEAKVAEFTDAALKEFAINYALGYTPNVTGTLKGATALRDAEFASNAANNIGGISNNSIDALLQANTSGSSTPPTNLVTNLPVAFNSPNVFKIGAVISGHGLLAVINALNNVHGADLLVAPNVTVQNAQKATLSIIQQFYYPKTFDPPKLSNQENLAININLTTANFGYVPVQLAIPPTPRDFGEEDLGVILEVKPTAMDQRIDLDLIRAESVDFDGFINYGQGIVQRSTDQNPNQEGQTIAAGVINQPVFEDRFMSTRIQVQDGQTAVLGGLMREDTQEIDDKVPLLGDLPLIGRAFRSKVSSRTKKNLIFFITANLVRSNGKPQYAKILNGDNLSNPQLPNTKITSTTPVLTPATTTTTTTTTVDTGPLPLPQ